MENKKLTRSNNRMLAGVCAGDWPIILAGMLR